MHIVELFINNCNARNISVRNKIRISPKRHSVREVICMFKKKSRRKNIMLRSWYFFLLSTIHFVQQTRIWFIKYVFVTKPAYSWWRHQMETFSALLALVLGLHRWPVNSPHKGQLRGVWCYLSCTWTNGWVNSRYAGALRLWDAIALIMMPL